MTLYGLIGFPLSHSFSGTYFADKFRREGITDIHYELFPLSHISQLNDLLANNKNLAGLNVTIPYKQEVISLLNEIDEPAAEIGAVNTIKIQRVEGRIKLKGYNTDAYGFGESLKPLLKSGDESSKALILGTGGASKAVEWVLGRMGIDMIFVSRNPRKPGHISYEMIGETLMKEAKIIVNTSPAGMYPNTDEYPRIPYQYVTSEHILYDLVYNPEETLFMKKGKEKGAVIKNGLQMLQLQADKSWEIWASPPAPSPGRRGEERSYET